jgi:hypothetical protein
MIGTASPKAKPQPEPTSPRKRSPSLATFQHAAEGGPILELPRLIATQNLQKTLAAARQRVCDSHKYQMRLLGETVDKCDDGGGINVRGNTTINGLNGWATAAIILVSLLAGGGGIAIYGAVTKHPCAEAKPMTPTPAANVDSWRLGIEVRNEP